MARTREEQREYDARRGRDYYARNREAMIRANAIRHKAAYGTPQAHQWLRQKFIRTLTTGYVKRPLESTLTKYGLVRQEDGSIVDRESGELIMKAANVSE